ncbi:ABC transporter substrate-binding protein/permease [Xylocopilactobacillus apis]|uniref:ABC transporter permease n=1 Tax=Xylocopilactobacillus apis TaxID=2932183 RepID=A0AAU9DKK5_9LACO|nr:ABC transporter substrate-binding protein/permease [Xylocopilactobacillus apis]BDR57372.1 ABC transporter permease [Xylocopilactobacillus apis]
MKRIFSRLILGLSFLLLILGGTFTSVHAADNSLDKIKSKGVLIMGTSPDYPPYEFLVNQHGKEQVVGMDVEIAKKIAKDLGVKLQIKKMDFDSLLVGLETGKIDMVLSAMSPTAEREKSVEFSNIYYKSGQGIIVNKADEHLYHDKDSFANKTVGAQSGSLQSDLIKKQMKKSKGRYLTKVTDLVLALKSHKIEGIVAESAVSTAYVKNDPSLAYIKGGFDLGSDQAGTAIAFPKGAKTLAQAVNKSLSEIKKDKLIDKYLSDAGKLMAGNTSNTSMLHYWKYFANGVYYTLLISVVSAIFGVLIGMLFALMRLSRNKVLHDIAVAYIEFIRGSPLMVQIMFVYFGLGLFINIPALLSGIIAVSLNSAAYVAEIIRGGINSIPKGQTEAARSLGLSRLQTMQSVILPQAIKNIWPSLGNEFISLIKESSIVSIIGVTDLIYQLRAVQTATYKGVAPIVVAMILYFIMTFGLSKVLLHFERKMKHDS